MHHCCCHRLECNDLPCICLRPLLVCSFVVVMVLCLAVGVLLAAGCVVRCGRCVSALLAGCSCVLCTVYCCRDPCCPLATRGRENGASAASPLHVGSAIWGAKSWASVVRCFQAFAAVGGTLFFWLNGWLVKYASIFGVFHPSQCGSRRSPGPLLQCLEAGLCLGTGGSA